MDDVIFFAFWAMVGGIMTAIVASFLVRVADAVAFHDEILSSYNSEENKWPH